MDWDRSNPWNQSFGEPCGIIVRIALTCPTYMTHRYKGFSSLMKGFASAGLLDLQSSIELNSRGGWQSFLAQSLSQVLQTHVKNDKHNLFSALSSIMTEREAAEVLEAAEWYVQCSMASTNVLTNASSLGDCRLSMTPPISSINSSPSALPLVPPKHTPALDLFARLLAHKLRYLPGERDTVLLSHEIISRPIGSLKEHRLDQIHTSTLIVRQEHPQVTAMAMTVSLPLAIAALRVLDGHVQTRGVVGPTAEKGIYRPVLEEMGTLGLVMKEETTVRLPGHGIASRMMQSMTDRHP